MALKKSKITVTYQREMDLYPNSLEWVPTGQAQIIKTLKLEHLNQHMKLIGKITK